MLACFRQLAYQAQPVTFPDFSQAMEARQHLWVPATLSTFFSAFADKGINLFVKMAPMLSVGTLLGGQ